MTSKREQFYKQQIADLQVENAALKEQVAELLKVNAELVGKVAKLSKNSSNSSKPPSSDIVKPLRGRELSLLGDYVVSCGKPFYADPRYDVFDPTVFSKVFLTSSSGRDVVWVSNQNSKRILCFDHIDKKSLNRSMANPRNQFLVDWARLSIRKEPLWSYECSQSVAIAVCSNAVVVAEKSKIVALNLKNGSLPWPGRRQQRSSRSFS